MEAKARMFAQFPLSWFSSSLLPSVCRMSGFTSVFEEVGFRDRLESSCFRVISGHDASDEEVLTPTGCSVGTL